MNVSKKQLKALLWIVVFTIVVILFHQNGENTATIKFLWFTKDIPIFLIIALSALSGSIFYLLMQFFFSGKKSQYHSDEL